MLDKMRNRGSNYEHVLILLGQQYGFAILSGVAEFASKVHWYTSPLHYSPSQPFTISSSTCDGILIGDQFPLHVLDAVVRSGIPCVNMSSRHPGVPMPRVVGDYDRIGRLAAEHFLERGYRHLSYYGVPERPSSAMQKVGYENTLRDHGFSVTDLTQTNESPEKEFAGTLPWEDEVLISALQSLPLPNAVFCYNDANAVAFLTACRVLGFRVPDDIAILGVGDDPIYCRIGDVPLSSVKHDLYQVGYQAAAYLYQIINGQRSSSQPILITPTGIVVRHSTDRLAVNHPELRKALDYIRLHFREPIGLDQVASNTQLSRRALQALFKREYQFSVTGFIQWVRLDFAKDSLLQTDKQIATIAAECGFGGVEYFHRVFKRSEGCTPRQFRVRHRRPLAEIL